MNTQTRTGISARKHGAWQRVTRAWLVAMLLGILALAMTIPAIAAAPPGGGVTSGPGGPLNPHPTVVVGTPTQPPISSSPVGGIRDSCTYNLQCINDVHVEAGGKYVDFLVGTSQDRTATVQISQSAPQKLANGDYSYSGIGVDGFAFMPAAYSHFARLSGLEPDTTYHYLVNAAKGSAGNDAQQVGTFHTLKRYVTVTIDKISVLDDSDALSAGDLVFNLNVNGSSPAIYPAAETTQWSSGTTRNVGLQTKVASGSQLSVTLKGWDWDTNTPDWLAGDAINIDNVSFNAGDRADVSQTYDITGDDADDAVSGTIFFITLNQSLKYQATGTFLTSYGA